MRLLGRPQVEADEVDEVDGQLHPRRHPQPRGQKSWAVLARVALSQRAPTRRQLAAELFDDAEDPLGALRWTLADIRRAVDRHDVLRGDPVGLPDDVWVDARLLAAGTLPVEEVGAVLLEGVDLRGCPGFDTWLLLARSHAAARAREELRAAALDLLSRERAEDAVRIAHRAAVLDPLDEDAQELFVRSLVAAGYEGQAALHLTGCLAAFAAAGLEPSPALRSAARRREVHRTGVRAATVAISLLRAGNAALAAGAPDAGVDTLRRAVEEAERARDRVVLADALHALGRALVHSVRGYDGEGAVVLHRALGLVREQGRPSVEGDVLRELGFVDVQAGRHTSAGRALTAARVQADLADDDALRAGVLALEGMNSADRGRHVRAAELLTASAETAARSGQPRQQAWSLGVLSRSLLLGGDPDAARRAADASIGIAHRERWNAFLPWPQVLHAQALAEDGDWRGAQGEAEEAFALACELGDPCWEGMAARALGLFAAHGGDLAAGRSWLTEARRRSDRVADRYVWVSAYIGLADLQLSVAEGHGVTTAAQRLHDEALRADLPELLAWALVHQAESGDPTRVAPARAAAADVDDPGLKARAAALSP